MNMNSSEVVSEYIIANGPQSLKDILENHYEMCQKDAFFAQQAHYILYQFGSQQSLIKVDMSERPYQFWYYDLMGRPITAIVKETFANFLTDVVGEEGLFIEDAVINDVADVDKIREGEKHG